VPLLFRLTTIADWWSLSTEALNIRRFLPPRTTFVSKLTRRKWWYGRIRHLTRYFQFCVLNVILKVGKFLFCECLFVLFFMVYRKVTIKPCISSFEYSDVPVCKVGLSLQHLNSFGCMALLPSTMNAAPTNNIPVTYGALQVLYCIVL